jgi:hypothetical protein
MFIMQVETRKPDLALHIVDMPIRWPMSTRIHDDAAKQDTEPIIRSRPCPDLVPTVNSIVKEAHLPIIPELEWSSGGTTRHSLQP